MKVVVLVPRRAGIEDRDRLWEFVSRWWATEHPEWTIHVGASPEGPFNRGAAINAAARAAGDWDIALVVDADVVADPAQVTAAVERAATTGRMTLAYSNYFALDDHTTAQILDGFNGDWRRGVRTKMAHHCSSILAVPRALWDQAGGFDERCQGWGHDDVIFAHVCRVLGGGIERVDGPVWHLFHKPSPEARKDQPGHRASAQLAKRYFAAVTPAACAEIIAERAEPDAVVLVVLTHGRRECIARSIPSARENLKGLPIARTVICDDSGDIDYQAWLRLTFPDCDLVTGKPGGFAGNVRRAWSAALGSGQPWAFWLEDDFTFNEPVDLSAMAKVMAANGHLSQVMLKRQPWFPKEIGAGGFMQCQPEAYTERSDGDLAWSEHQLGHWTNPHLVRRSFLASNEWPAGNGSEARFARQVMRGSTKAAVWGRIDDPPLVTHDGERTGTGY